MTYEGPLGMRIKSHEKRDVGNFHHKVRGRMTQSQFSRSWLVTLEHLSDSSILLRVSLSLH